MTTQKLTQRVLGKPITIIDIPDLPNSLLNWSTQNLNHFDKLLEYAYQQNFVEISWNYQLQ